MSSRPSDGLFLLWMEGQTCKTSPLFVQGRQRQWYMYFDKGLDKYVLCVFYGSELERDCYVADEWMTLLSEYHELFEQRHGSESEAYDVQKKTLFAYSSEAPDDWIWGMRGEVPKH